jgi:hypothetical protein
LQRGDHIAVASKKAGLKYYHHGIFLGEREGVVDFDSTDGMNATVCIATISEFTDQGRLTIHRYVYRT